MSHLPVIVIGAGQAGLSMSWHLKDRGVEHVVLEAKRFGSEWRESRWDSFCLVTPNWQCQLPGFPYDGDDPHGFMVKDEIVGYLERYVASFDPPLREGVAVSRVRRAGEVLEVTTDDGEVLTAGHVVIATGCYQNPIMPPWAAALDLPDPLQHHKNAEQLTEGAGAHRRLRAVRYAALNLAGREVHLCLDDATPGRAPTEAATSSRGSRTSANTG